MSHFASFSYVENNQRVSTRISLDGHTQVVVFDREGAVVSRGSDHIDSRDAHRIITDLFSVAGQLSSNPQGNIFIEVGDGAQSRAIAVTGYDLPTRGHEVAAIVRTIAKDILAGYEHRNPRRQGGPVARHAGALGLLKYGAAFFGAFFVAQIVKAVLLVAGGLTGPLSFSIAVTVGWVLPFAAFYGIGERFGQEYRGNSQVLIAAVPATIAVVWAAYAIGWVGFFALMGVIALPIAAKMGEQAGY